MAANDEYALLVLFNRSRRWLLARLRAADPHRNTTHAMVERIDIIQILWICNTSDRAYETNPFGRPSFASQPSYVNFSKQRIGDSLDASVELSRCRNAAFLAVSASELALVSSELPPKVQRFTYWRPMPAPFASFSRPMAN